MICVYRCLSTVTALKLAIIIYKIFPFAPSSYIRIIKQNLVGQLMDETDNGSSSQ